MEVNKELHSKKIKELHSKKIQALWRGHNLRKKDFLEPCDPNELGINVLKINETLKTDYFRPTRMRYINSTRTKNLKLEDGLMEFIVADSMNGKHVGDGHYPIDVVKEEKGIDVLCVCLNGNQTNEKSLTQSFKDSADELELFFKEKKTREAIELYKRIWYKKLCQAKKEHNLKKLYYLGFISTNTKIYMSVFKINLDAIFNIKDLGFTKQAASINFENVIEDQYGKTKLYKSKKRMEVRFKKSILECFNTIEIYALPK